MELKEVSGINARDTIDKASNKDIKIKNNLKPYTTKSVIIDQLSRGELIPYRETKGKYLHVSDLLHKCVRKICIHDKVGIKYPCDRTSPSMKVLHSTGHSIQKNICDTLIESNEVKLFGTWSCDCGKTKVVGTIEQGKCKQCLSKIYNFSDLLIKDDELKLVGAIDIPILKDGALILGECKSMTNTQWEGLSNALSEHVLQIMIYWHILHKKKKVKLHDKVFLIYTRKEYKYTSPYKEFTICPSKYDFSVLNIYLEEARKYAKYLDLGKLPERVSCKDPNQKRAKNCMMSDICFSCE